MLRWYAESGAACNECRQPLRLLYLLSRNNNWNIGIAYSQRAFLLAPVITRAWRAYTTTTRKYDSVSREINMNRFTDGLQLPSEDEAIKVYQETYGKRFEEQ